MGTPENGVKGFEVVMRDVCDSCEKWQGKEQSIKASKLDTVCYLRERPRHGHVNVPGIACALQLGSLLRHMRKQVGL